MRTTASFATRPRTPAATLRQQLQAAAFARRSPTPGVLTTANGIAVIGRPGVAVAIGGTSFVGNGSNVVGLTINTGLGKTVASSLATAAATPTLGQFFVGAWGNSTPAGTIICQALLPFGTFVSGDTYSVNWEAKG